jgi:hypothetical protein
MEQLCGISNYQRCGSQVRRQRNNFHFSAISYRLRLFRSLQMTNKLLAPFLLFKWPWLVVKAAICDLEVRFVNIESSVACCRPEGDLAFLAPMQEDRKRAFVTLSLPCVHHSVSLVRCARDAFSSFGTHSGNKRHSLEVLIPQNPATFATFLYITFSNAMTAIAALSSLAIFTSLIPVVGPTCTLILNTTITILELVDVCSLL